MVSKTKLKTQISKDNIMTEATEKKSRKGGSRKPQEFIVVVKATNKADGTMLDLNDYDVTLTSASGKDFKSILAEVRSTPGAVAIDVQAPQSAKKQAETAAA